jgi:hypothetical protein
MGNYNTIATVSCDANDKLKITNIENGVKRESW